MNTEQQLHQVELDMEQAKALVQRGKNLMKLTHNKEFKAIIEDGYCKEEVLRVTMLRADASQQSPEAQEQLNKTLDGMAYLQLHFRTIMQLARMAEKSLEDQEQERELLLEEDAA